MVTINGGFTDMLTSRGFTREIEEPRPTLVTGRAHLAWGAVVAGSLTAISLLVLAGAFAYAIHLPGYYDGDYGFIAGLYAVLASVAAFLAGGMMVSYLSPRYEERMGLVHGLMAWMLAIPLMVAVAGFSIGAFHGYMLTDATRFNLDNTGARSAMAWGTFIALFMGMLAAAAGGMIGFLARETVCKNRACLTPSARVPN